MAKTETSAREGIHGQGNLGLSEKTLARLEPVGKPWRCAGQLQPRHLSAISPL